ncbi:hypothetical protein, partial [Acidithiobacillus ferrivorans]|uniref:hypothetical protein n=1 Tax=Acidithiobacillus ferrivorans TaxID=160808 RepID=UPI001C4006B8
MIHRASRNRSFLTKASVPFMHLLSAFAKRPERSIHAFFVAITLLIAYFTPSWAPISNDRGQSFQTIVGAHFTQSWA